ncbi:MAG: RNA polymerase sigma factor [Longimicrobiales bacterium]
MIQAAQRLSRGLRSEGRTIMEAALPPPQDVDQSLLIRALRQREEAAFRELLDRHQSAMLRLAMSHVGSRARAEEVVQDTWMAVINGIDRFRGDSTVKTWLFRILLNRARSYARREARAIPFSDAAAVRGGVEESTETISQQLPADARNAWTGWSGPGPAEATLNGELRARIDEAIQQLPSRQRLVLVMRDLEGCSSEEVRAVLRISEGNQRVLLHRARTRVRDLLEPYLTETATELDGPKTNLS